MITPSDKTLLIKDLSAKYGFSQVGIAKADHLDEAARNLEQWLAKGYHGTMGYMENHFDLRVDPRKLVPGARSVISFLYNYMPANDDLSTENHKIARYAYGRDYHKVIKKKLKQLVTELQDKIGNFDARCFTDSAPIMEREWAERAGLGWKGKNTLLINTKKGSYYFLAEIICDLELEYEAPISDHCGSCTKCIDACPTDAIAPNGYILDASKCISYLTIERKKSLPEELREHMDDWMFGCDICQEICPWNRFSTPHSEPDFTPKEKLVNMKKSDWVEITEEIFDTLFEGSAVRRTKYDGLRRNIEFLNEQ